jgi:hypothetical protein
MAVSCFRESFFFSCCSLTYPGPVFGGLSNPPPIFSGQENACLPVVPGLSSKGFPFDKRSEEPFMADTPAMEDVLRSALSGIDDDDVRLFYSYFAELKHLAQSLLRRKARAFPGESAVAHSALLSMLADVPVQQIPLTDSDEEGYPALWPLLLRYVERHCNKWNKYYRAKKRQGKEVALGTHGESQPAVDPVDAGPSPSEEAEFAEAWEVLEQKLAPRQYQVATPGSSGQDAGGDCPDARLLGNNRFQRQEGHSQRTGEVLTLPQGVHRCPRS